MPIFVTGATSFIGRVMVKQLAREGESLRVLARASSNRTGMDLPGVELDVTDPAAVRRGMAGCDLVVHIAAVVGGGVPESVRAISELGRLTRG